MLLHRVPGHHVSFQDKRQNLAGIHSILRGIEEYMYIVDVVHILSHRRAGEIRLNKSAASLVVPSESGEHSSNTSWSSDAGDTHLNHHHRQEAWHLLLGHILDSALIP